MQKLKKKLNTIAKRISILFLSFFLLFFLPVSSERMKNPLSGELSFAADISQKACLSKEGLLQGTGLSEKAISPEMDLSKEISLHKTGASEKGLSAETEESSGELLRHYQIYQDNFQSIEQIEDIETNNYTILKDQVFSPTLESFGEGDLTLIPALENTWHRLALFLADEAGKICWKTNQLETNNCVSGQLLQPVSDIAAISFADANRDGLTDLILITYCVNDTGDYTGIPYKVGDVLFQREGSFYRDWRISDKINRFSMNKSTNQILFFARDGKSAEFLYTASTLEELLENGFTIIEDMCYTRKFEKLGSLKVVPGTFQMAWYDIFMIYLVNEQGNIVWSFQPMGDYDNLYALKGINGRDVDGDGMKDLVVLGRYSTGDISEGQQIESKCTIYYQRTGGFEMDTEFDKYYQCTEDDTMEKLIQKIREYWGWQVEE